MIWLLLVPALGTALVLFAYWVLSGRTPRYAIVSRNRALLEAIKARVDAELGQDAGDVVSHATLGEHAYILSLEARAVLARVISAAEVRARSGSGTAIDDAIAALPPSTPLGTDWGA
jgi:hypothetical protein